MAAAVAPASPMALHITTEADDFSAQASRGARTCVARPHDVSRDHHTRLHHIDGFRRIQSVTFLLVGAASGIIGFAFAGFLGIYKYKRDRNLAGTDLRGDPFVSGKNFHPATVSEMVRDPASPEGKIFFAFCMLASISILVSAYPFSLSNVFIGHDHSRPFRLCGGRLGETPIWVSPVSLRQFLPPIGLMMVVCIEVTSGPRTFCEGVAASVHTMGAVMMFATYIAFEFHSLWWSDVVKLVGRERCLRRWLAIGALVFALGFQLGGGLSAIYMRSCSQGQCDCAAGVSYWKLCVDQWKMPSDADIEYARSKGHHGAWVRQVLAREEQKELLANTASGWFLTLKEANYWMEVFAGLCLLTSHLVIWYFCPERRHVELGTMLPDIPNPYRSMDEEHGGIAEASAESSTARRCAAGR